jgi:acyl-CoA synthetase (AMP-forming)/AMP-acid ligase II
MERRWYKVWPLLVHKGIEVEKPVSEYMKDWAALVPNNIALRFYGYDITYWELDEAINQFAQGLLSLGLKKGDRVALFMQNCPQFVISYFGTLRAGGVVVPLNPMFKQAELEYEISDAHTEIMVGLDYLYPEVLKIKNRLPLRHVILTSLSDYLPEKPILSIPPEAGKPKRSFPEALDFQEFLQKSPKQPICRVNDLKEDLALLQYTGGTTGTPKGAMISHYNLAYASVAAVYWFRLRDDDVFLGVTPFFHVMGMLQLMCAPLISGGQVILLARFVPDVVAQAIANYRCTLWTAPTTMYLSLLQLPNLTQYDFSSLRVLVSGGTPISVDIQNKMKEMAPRATLGEGYGLSECVSSGGVVTPLYHYKPGFIGIPQFSDIKIMDLERGEHELPANEEGEIVIKGSTVMKGYWNRPEETEKVLKDGWLSTGDIGLMDEEGYVKVVGRKKELILCSGYNVFPAEVENLLFRHPAVAEAAVIGIPDPYRGESPKAFIVVKAEYRGKITGEEIMEWCRANMATYKRPRAIEFREDLPKSGAGKILRRVLAEEEKGRG